jgi:hypothetical protein
MMATTKYLVKTSHPIYAKLQEQHSLPAKISCKQKHSSTASQKAKADDKDETNRR